jgi:hypothetical protein
MPLILSGLCASPALAGLTLILLFLMIVGFKTLLFPTRSPQLSDPTLHVSVSLGREPTWHDPSSGGNNPMSILSPCGCTDSHGSHSDWAESGAYALAYWGSS